MSILYTELLGAVVGHLEIDATDASRFEFDANIATAQLGLKCFAVQVLEKRRHHDENEY